MSQRSAAPPPSQSRFAGEEAIFDFWLALEYLSPLKPPQPEAKDGVFEVDPSSSEADQMLPWENPGIRDFLDRNDRFGIRRKHLIHAGVIPGSLFVEDVRRLLGVEMPEQFEKPDASSAASLMMTADCDGFATGEVFISSLPWAMGNIVTSAPTGRLRFGGFFGQNAGEEKIKLVVKNVLERRRVLQPPKRKEGDPPSDHHPLCIADIQAVVAEVFAEAGWKPAQTLPLVIQARRLPKEGAKERSNDPLNSFYAVDLQRVRLAMRDLNVGRGFENYLRDSPVDDRVDVIQDTSALLAGVQPKMLPRARFPAQHPLATAQQFAVDLAVKELGDRPGTFGVNGPPGTGKTTLLKDVIAHVVADRAKALAAFADPKKAFGALIDIDDYQWKVPAALHPSLCGFGIVVSSSNNGAVENISRELPTSDKTIDASKCDYFSAVSETIATDPKKPVNYASKATWGLVSAVLGSSERRGEFRQAFWWDGITSSKKEDKLNGAPPDPGRRRSLQDVMYYGDHEAASWSVARETYSQAANRVDALTMAVQAGVEALHGLASLQQQSSDLKTHTASLDELVAVRAKQQLEAERDAERATKELARVQWVKNEIERHRTAQRSVVAAVRVLSAATAMLPTVGSAVERAKAEAAKKRRIDASAVKMDKLLPKPPGFLADFFKTKYSTYWHSQVATIDAEINDADKEEQEAKENFDVARAAELMVATAQQELADAQQDLSDLAHDLTVVKGLDISQPLDRLVEMEKNCRNEAQRVIAIAASAKTKHRQVIEERAAVHQKRQKSDVDIATALKTLAECGATEDEIKGWIRDCDEHRTGYKDLHLAAPFRCEVLLQARADLFLAAMQLHKSFVVATWSQMQPLLGAFCNLLAGEFNAGQVRGGVMQLWDAFFLVVPVVSTTFASLPRLFAGVGREQLAWMLIDEAGQAAPQHAIGAIWRSRRSVIVGDPLQLEPVVPMAKEILAQLARFCGCDIKWSPTQISAQGLADRGNRHGTYRGNDPLSKNGRLWLGSPLVVHRRCLDPMYSIANEVAYENGMVYGTRAPQDAFPTSVPDSTWFDLKATSTDGNWIPEHGKFALDLLKQLVGNDLKQDGKFKAYIISPFTDVRDGIGPMLRKVYGKACEGMFGTVHTFQGKEAPYVIFLLGGAPNKPGLISRYAGAKPNLVNVAVTRAKHRLYVIGDRGFWTGPGDRNGYYATQANHLPVVPISAAPRSRSGA